METCTIPKALYDDMVSTLKEYASYVNWSTNKADTYSFYSNMWYMNESGYIRAQKIVDQIKTYESIKSNSNSGTN